MGPGDTAARGNRMPHPQTRLAGWFAAAAVGASLVLSGCADGIDLNGKVFDMVGVSPAAQEARRTEPRLAERAPLVLPPDSRRLPPPGTDAAPAAAQMAWPDDPQQRKVREAQERERLHLAYCRGDAEWKERALASDREKGAPRSPYGPCPSLFGNVTTNVNKN
jgi:hypothetical protein